jgi:plasmid stability protein
MNDNQVQYTLRKVPDYVDRALRQRAKEQHKSLNEVALEVLERGLGLAGETVRHSDLDDLVGTWVDDPEFDRALEEMDQVDSELWR